MSTRHAEIHRTTAETDVVVSMELDGSGTSHIDTGIGFFDHMLTLFAAHARVDLTVTCHGDIEVDGHHTVEDIGISIGDAFRTAIGEKRGISRYGTFFLPMEITLHVKILYGKNSHHRVEAVFKALAHALRSAIEKDARAGDEIPSTKGLL